MKPCLEVPTVIRRALAAPEPPLGSIDRALLLLASLIARLESGEFLWR